MLERGRGDLGLIEATEESFMSVSLLPALVKLELTEENDEDLLLF